MDMLKTDYGADSNEEDFVHHTEEARAALNSWVEHRTQGKIKDLFPQGALDSKTRLVLANAIYFKGKWASRFKSAETHDAPFTAPANQRISVAMMQQVGSFKYLDDGGFQALELPYQSDKLAMDVFLPRKVDGLVEFEKAVTAERLVEWIARLQQKTVRVALPKFKMTSAFELNHALAEMGMPLAFDAGADFTGMSDRGKELFLSKVIHKAYVEVNEEGTEAAAATGQAVLVATVMPRPIDFRADHPFFFLIRDIASGTILFMGRMENPR
jgi:serpin B